MPPFTSVFVGGGTPSRVAAASLLDVLAAAPLAAEAEVSIECNPEDVTADLLDAYRAGGVNRLSLGVQSAVPHVLDALGRRHGPEHVTGAVREARAVGFDNINLDVIYGAVGESLGDWRRTLDGVIALEPDHVSAYGLTVEPGTALAADRARHPDDDDQADKYVLANEVLGAAGFEWYEVSNWARPGRQCRHNLLYWTQGEYLGIGCAAHSHRGGRRWWNVRTPERYIAAVSVGESPEAGSEALATDERRREALQLSLRTRTGVPSTSLPVDDLADLVEPVGDRVVLTVRGRLLANEVAVRLR